MWHEADERRALDDPVIAQCCAVIDRMFDPPPPARATPTEDDLARVLTGHPPPPPEAGSLHPFDTSFLSEFQEAFVERHLFLRCLERCDLADRPIASIQPDEIARVCALLEQCGYGLDFFVDDEQFLNYRLYALPQKTPAL